MNLTNRHTQTGKELGASRAALLCLYAFVLAMFAPAMVATGAFAQVPAAGTIIDNQAEATWFNPEINKFERLLSNEVSVQTTTLEDGILTADRLVNRLPGDIVVFPHRLENTGNAFLQFTIAAANLSGDDYDLLNLRLFKDVNGSGAPDPGEPEILPSELVGLQPGAGVDLLISGVVPQNVSNGVEAKVGLTAITPSGLLMLSNTDTVIADENVSILFNKDLVTTDPVQGGRLRYRLQLINNGFQPLNGLTLKIDGVEQTTPSVLIRDPIPANTSYVDLEHSNNGRVLYHLRGFDEFDLVSVAPFDISQIVTIVYALEVLPAGDPIELFLELDVSDNAAGEIDNQANVVFTGVGGRPITELSNLTETPLPEKRPEIDFHADDQFDGVIEFSRAGVPLYVEADAAACNTDSSVFDTQTINLIARDSGDFESVQARETGPNTGVFRIIPEFPTTATTAEPTHNNGLLELLFSDQVTASLNGCGQPVSAVININPGGTVYDSRTSEPVPGALVVLIDVSGEGNGGVPGGPAFVFAQDGTTVISNEFITDENGRFEFPVVPPSIYRIEVFPPETTAYFFPSLIPPSEQPPRRLIPESLAGEGKGPSYGGRLLVGARGPVVLDIPLDLPIEGLQASITVSDDVLDIGDLVRVTVKMTNLSGANLTQTTAVVGLPPGFVFKPGSVLLNGQPIADPQIVNGQLLFSTGQMDIDAIDDIEFLVQVGAGAVPGSFTVVGDSLETNPDNASVSVTLRAAQFHGYIIGKVYLDCDRDRIQGVEEIGIPGVRIYMEDGTYVVTDAEGKYNFYGVAPGTHVLKVDSETLPRDSVLLTLDNRHAGDAHSRFVDLKRNEIHKANFAEGSCSDTVKQEVKRRRGNGEVFVGEVENVLSRPLDVRSRTNNNIDSRRLPARGVAQGQQLPNFLPLADDISRENSNLPDAPVAEVATVPLADRIASFDNKTEFVDIKDGDILPYPRLNFVAKGHNSGTLVVSLNGEPISDDKVGLRVRDPKRKLVVQEWIGIHLEAGPNALTLSLLDPFGNTRYTQTVTVLAPGDLTKVVVNVNEDGVPADGVSMATVQVLLMDENGIPVTTSMPLTIESSAGRWMEEDAQPTEPGLQVLIRGGKAELKLQAPQKSIDAQVRVTSGVLKGEAEVSFLPPLRDMIVVGLVEGRIGKNDGAHDLGFERELKAFADESSDGQTRSEARAAVFAQGRVGKRNLLTVSYDSEKDNSLRLFRDIRPDEFYPVYGDSSVRGFEARSTSKLYLRLDRGLSFVQYGDFNSAQQNAAVSLGRFNRSLTGILGHYESRRWQVNAFGSRGTSTQEVVELRGRGISGPYEIGTDVGINSERVELVTRDREAPDVELSSRPLARFTDYVIDAARGELLFRDPIASADSEFNPQFIRVTYERNKGGKRFWVTGVNAQFRVNQKLEVGAGYAQDRDPENRYRVGSINATLKLTERTQVIAEMARTNSDEHGSDDARRLEIEHQGERVQGRVYYGESGESFDNTTAGLGRGRREYGARMSLRVTERTRLNAELLQSTDVAQDTQRRGGHLTIERSLTDKLRLEVGYRQSSDSGNSSTRNARTVRLKLTGQLPKLPRGSMFVEYERDLHDAGKELAALGLEYQISDRGRLYARHEFVSSLEGRFALESGNRTNRSVVGLDTDYMRNGHVFSEYRLRDSINGRDAEAALGLRNLWQLTPGLGLQTTFERTKSMSENNQNDSTAATVGVEYTGSPLWKSSARLEYRKSTSGDSWYTSLALARKLSREWTFLGRNTLSLRETATNRRTEDRLQLGLSYRPVDSDRWNALARYEFEVDKDDPINGSGNDKKRRSLHRWSAHVNYQPRNRLTLSGHYAGKRVEDALNDGRNISSDAHLLTGRATWDMTERWDFSLQGSSYFTNSFNQRRYGLGAEVGYLLHTNLWLSAGYNWFGYDDSDIAEAEYTQRGVYLRMRWKFDERLFEDFASPRLQHNVPEPLPPKKASCDCCCDNRYSMKVGQGVDTSALASGHAEERKQQAKAPAVQAGVDSMPSPEPRTLILPESLTVRPEPESPAPRAISNDRPVARPEAVEPAADNIVKAAASVEKVVKAAAKKAAPKPVSIPVTQPRVARAVPMTQPKVSRAIPMTQPTARGTVPMTQPRVRTSVPMTQPKAVSSFGDSQASVSEDALAKYRTLGGRPE